MERPFTSTPERVIIVARGEGHHSVALSLVVLGMAGGASVLAAPPSSRIDAHGAASAKKVCHYVVKKVRGKKKGLRVCRAASADVRFALASSPCRRCRRVSTPPSRFT